MQTVKCVPKLRVCVVAVLVLVCGAFPVGGLENATFQATAGGITNQQQNGTGTSPRAELPIAPASPNRIAIGVGDILAIKVYNAPDLSQTLRVDDGGEISVPLLGRVNVQGRSANEVEALLEKLLYEERILNAPHVNVIVQEYATQGISVFGEVQKPGIYAFSAPRRLFDVISAAGGLAEKAGGSISIVRRQEPGKVLTVDLPRNLAMAGDANVELFPGDTVLVSKAGVVYVVGEVEKPGGFITGAGGSLTVLQALALAEGPKSTAALNSAKLIRRKGGTRVELEVPLTKILSGRTPDFELEDEDILFVPNSLAKSAGKRTIEAIIQTATGLVIWRR